jgi:tetratricopeptide (TPR) repeat protein
MKKKNEDYGMGSRRAASGKNNFSSCYSGNPRVFNSKKIPSRYISYLACEAALFFLLFTGCSSAPKPPTQIVIERNTAVKQLDLANHTANRGRFEDALLILEDSRRLAVITDDPVLRLKTSISRGNILFSLGRHPEAFRDWEIAALEGASSGQAVLAALARIYAIRGRIVMLADGDGAAEELKAYLERELSAVRSDPNASAAAYVTLGLAEKQMQRWTEAERALRQALAVHERELFLEEAAYDWFVIASVRSMSGDYDAALQALTTAINFDRRAENGFGLASSWQAMGDVYQKAGNDQKSLEAWSRAAEIYRALGLDDRAEILDDKAKKLKNNYDSSAN